MRSMPDEGRRNVVTSPALTNADRPDMNHSQTVCGPPGSAPYSHVRNDATASTDNASREGLSEALPFTTRS